MVQHRGVRGGGAEYIRQCGANRWIWAAADEHGSLGTERFPFHGAAAAAVSPGDAEFPESREFRSAQPTAGKPGIRDDQFAGGRESVADCAVGVALQVLIE